MKIFHRKYLRTLYLSLVLLVVAGEFFFAYLSQTFAPDVASIISRDWKGRPSLLDAGDYWILAYREARYHGLDPQSLLHIRFSPDEGITWTNDDVFLDGQAVLGFPLGAHHAEKWFDASEGILAKASNGDLLLFVREEGITQNGTYVWRSNDGGANWEDEGKISNDSTLLMGGQAVSVAHDMYATFWVDENADYEPPFKTVLYKSSDYGKSWIYVNDVTSNGTAESALAYLGTNELLVVLADDIAGEKTYLRRSFDLGRTWGELQNVTDVLGILGRPQLQVFSDEPSRLYLYGRQEQGELDYTVVYYSDDKGATWSKKFYPGTIPYPDTGYSTLLKRSDGNFYMFTYGGIGQWAELKEYIFPQNSLEAPL